MGNIINFSENRFLASMVLIVIILCSGCLQLGEEKSQPRKGIIDLTEKYSNYGFSFKYPKGMQIEEMGFLDEYAADETSGILVGEYYPNEEDALFIKISWIKMPTPHSSEEEYSLLDAGINASFDLLSEVIKSANSFTKKEKREMKINNMRVLYQEYLLDFSSEDYPNRKLYGVTSSFYCYKSRRAYTFNLAYSKNESLSLLQEFLRNFNC